MPNNSIKNSPHKENEIILNALLEASQTLLNKIDRNIDQIIKLEVKTKKGEKTSEKEGELFSDKTSLACL